MWNAIINRSHGTSQDFTEQHDITVGGSDVIAVGVEEKEAAHKNHVVYAQVLQTYDLAFPHGICSQQR